MSQHFKVDDLLSDEHYQEFAALAAHRTTTIDKAWSWLRQHGYKISRSAVGLWMQRMKSDPAARIRDQLKARIDQMDAQQLQSLMEKLP